MKQDKFKMIGIWKFSRLDKVTGKILDTEIIKNTIVNNGLNLVRDFLGDVSVNAPKYIAIGTDGTGAAIGDTALYVETDRQLGAIDVGTNYVVEFTYTFSFGVPTTIQEAGLFDNAVASGSTMFNRVTTSKSVDVGIDLIVTATITIARA
jgi:hypothetical protein